MHIISLCQLPCQHVITWLLASNLSRIVRDGLESATSADVAVSARMQALIKPARCWSSPTWTATSSDEMAWRLSCWQLDVPACTFWAARSHANKMPVQAFDIDIDESAQRSCE